MQTEFSLASRRKAERTFTQMMNAAKRGRLNMGPLRSRSPTTGKRKVARPRPVITLPRFSIQDHD